MSLHDEITTAINRTSAENGSNTPDFILAEYLTDCLAAFDKAANARAEWYGGSPETVAIMADPEAMAAIAEAEGEVSA